MNVVEVIQAVRAAGGSVTVNAGSLVVDAPPDLPADVWDALTGHKATLLELLAPSVTYADLAAQEEREAIQAVEADHSPPRIETVAFPAPRPGRRCRLVKSVPWQSGSLGSVIFPAGLDGYAVHDPSEIEDPLTRAVTALVLVADRNAGKATIPVLIDGKVRVLDADAVAYIDEGDPS